MRVLTKEFEHKYNANLGNLLREARKAKGLTLEQVSEITDRKKSSISDNERGKNSTPILVLFAYCDIYGIDADEVMKKAFDLTK